MNLEQQVSAPSTTEAVSAEAQSRERDRPGSAIEDDVDELTGYNSRYTIGKRVSRKPPKPQPHQRADPLYRPLRIFTMDPAVSRLDGATALVNVPFEPLAPGPVGQLFKVENYDGCRQVHYRKAELDDAFPSLKGGYDPSASEPRFHQQMVYAVCSNVYATFRRALGRHVAWGFDRNEDAERLLLRPHAFRGVNAYYDKAAGALCFGYDLAPDAPLANRTLPGGYVFTCLSHDVIAHELTHAILDGLRSNFSVPSGPDVVAFHEAFADLVAIFQRLSYGELVAAAIRKSRGQLEQASLLTDLAQQLGHVIGKKSALRSAIGEEPPKTYNPDDEPHELGAVLLAAVFEAFITIYRRKTARYIRLATHGTGIVPSGALSADLQEILAHSASRLASQFLSLIIRAIDYCPPVDIRFGEYLRALITADYDLVPDDKWAYREALIDAFLRRHIYPRHVSTLSEDALLWRPSVRSCRPITKLDFGHLRFEGDPACAASTTELERQARVLGEYVSRPEHMADFGLVARDSRELRGAHAGLPRVESIRSTRRIGPDGQIVFDLVAEVVQRCAMPGTNRAPSFEIYGGSTVILGPEGEIRYAILKSAVGADRLNRRPEFMASRQGSKYWTVVKNHYVLNGDFFHMLHAK
jgi:hypothetical protein